MLWAEKYTLQDLTAFANRNMILHLNIEFIELGSDFIKAKMPVDHRTTMPLGLLHGGASCVLAETLGSCASALCIDTEKESTVGIEINANHIKTINLGYVIGTVRPFHVGRSIHVWDIQIRNESNAELICISRLTTKVLGKTATDSPQKYLSYRKHPLAGLTKTTRK